MKSPYPPYAECILKCQPTEEEYKGEKFHIIEIFWFDPVTRNSFDSVETGNATVNQVYNAYRVKHGLPFPDELTTLREFLGLSASKMSAVLGLGANQYRLYEKGDMPADAVGRYIKMLINNTSALKDCIINAKDILSDNEYHSAIKAIESGKEDLTYKRLLSTRDKTNGFAPLSPLRLKNTILHFINTLGPISPTYLNKLLFYTDFLSYRKRGMAITGLSYRALPYGPVPNNWKYIPLIDGIEQEEVEMGTALFSGYMVDYKYFSSVEKEILDMVTQKFKNMTASTISKLSHLEDAWLESKSDVTTPISFDYAFSLKAI